eukprot:CAMPEP_0198142500 /NCGR_PEP_ID=MMETSP1443-20131203/5272_1 /TAXON_ID=186043 /ORGANISM="Entomoneis sp., Strain CCMP2396" /LENGTH=250 /DNA_ID=CAMNT_0043805521 /DNA_START=624 /DNA_END=1376 /DNA_ORIENTATION=-
MAERRDLNELQRFATNQLVGLLKVAGLDVPSNIILPPLEGGKKNKDSSGGASSDAQTEEEKQKFSRRNHEANKRAFVNNINWQKVDEMYKEALVDMEADIYTTDLYDNNPHARRKLIAHILSKIRIQREGLSMLEELIAIRRMTLLFEDNFEDLELEDYGSLWWGRAKLILTKARPYNTSPTALYKRVKKRAGDNGFSFTLHADKTVTLTIPSDFRDDELLNELKRNIYDFHELIGDGMEAIFYDGTVPN